VNQQWLARTAPWWVLCITATSSDISPPRLLRHRPPPRITGTTPRLLGPTDRHQPCARLADACRSRGLPVTTSSSLQMEGAIEAWATGRSLTRMSNSGGDPPTVERDARTVIAQSCSNGELALLEDGSGHPMLAVLPSNCVACRGRRIVSNVRMIVSVLGRAAATTACTRLFPVRCSGGGRCRWASVRASWSRSQSHLVPASCSRLRELSSSTGSVPSYLGALVAPMNDRHRSPNDHALLALERPNAAPTPAPSSVPMMAATAAYVLAGSLRWC